MEKQTLAGLLAPYRTGAIAEATGLPPNSISNWRVERAFPEPDRWKPLAAFLRIEIDAFFDLHRAYESRKNTAAA